MQTSGPGKLTAGFGQMNAGRAPRAALLLALAPAILPPTAARWSIKLRPKEPSASPAPRSAWSSYSTREVQNWRQCHSKLVNMSAAYVAGGGSGGSGARGLVLIGDSLMESWSEWTYCAKVPKYRGSQKVLLEELVEGGWGESPPLVLGISSDQTQHLLWRLQNGELSPGMRADPLLRMALLIGTNNLGSGHNASEVVAGVEAVVSYLLTATRGKLLVHGLLPRGDAARRPLAPIVGHTASGEPLCSFLPAIGAVNAALRSSAGEPSGRLRRQFGERLRYVECGAPFYKFPSGASPQSARSCTRGRGKMEAKERLVADMAKKEAANEVTVKQLSEKLAKSKKARRDASKQLQQLSSEGGRRLASEGGTSEVALDLMVDRIHPTLAGHKLWAGCLVDGLGWLDPSYTANATEKGAPSSNRRRRERPPRKKGGRNSKKKDRAV